MIAYAESLEIAESLPPSPSATAGQGTAEALRRGEVTRKIVGDAIWQSGWLIV